MGSLGVAGTRHGDVRLGRGAVPERCGERGPGSQARHDAAHRARDHRRLLLLMGCEPGPARPPARLLVGAGAAGGDHAAGALGRDALARADDVGARLAGCAAAGRGRETGGRRRRHRGADRAADRRPRRGAPGRTSACGRAYRAGVGEHGRVDAHGGIAPRAARRGRPGRSRYGGDGFRCARRGHRDRRRHRSRGDPTAGRAGAELHLAGAEDRGSRGRAAVLVRTRIRGDHRDRLGPRRPARRGGGANGHGAGDRLPARARAGDPARRLDRDGARGARGHPGEGPPGAREHARRRRGALRQDRHPDEGDARGDRRGAGRRRRSRRAARARGSGRVRFRASPRAGDRAGGGGARPRGARLPRVLVLSRGRRASRGRRPLGAGRGPVPARAGGGARAAGRRRVARGGRDHPARARGRAHGRGAAARRRGAARIPGGDRRAPPARGAGDDDHGRCRGGGRVGRGGARHRPLLRRRAPRGQGLSRRGSAARGAPRRDGRRRRERRAGAGAGRRGPRDRSGNGRRDRIGRGDPRER